MTAHQFRHAAAAIILKKRPGEYGYVQRVLGHRSESTTRRFYIALEMFSATEMFGELVENELDPAGQTMKQKRKPPCVQSLPLVLWPEADRTAWLNLFTTGRAGNGPKPPHEGSKPKRPSTPLQLFPRLCQKKRRL